MNIEGNQTVCAGVLQSLSYALRVRFIFLQGGPLWVGQPEAASTDEWQPDGWYHEGLLPEVLPES